MARMQPALPLAPRVPAAETRSDNPPTAIASAAAREQWCAIVLPQLPLEVRRASSEQPIAVFEPARRMILAANARAAESGVRPGQSTATAWAMCSTLTAFARDPAAEKEALERMAGWAAQFSPRVSVEADGIAFEIGASRRLFGGLGALLDRVDDGIAALGYTACRSCAPTPLAAVWLARGGKTGVVAEAERIAGALAPLPLGVMALDPGQQAALAGLGISRIGELARLPRAGLARRYGPALVAALDRALGRLPDPRRAWVPPPAFAGALELPVESSSLALIVLAYRRLAEELSGFLRARDTAARRLELLLETERQVIETTLECHAPLRDPERIVALIATRFEAFALPAPVQRVALRVADFSDAAPERVLPIGEDGREGDFVQARARLAARLGEAAVARLVMASDHRPERATRAVPADGTHSGLAAPRSGWPLLLLDEPLRLVEIAGRPCLAGRLETLDGCERIETGWWDGNDIARDYYRMRKPDGALLWVFRDRKHGGWYLHGAFA